jgi:hypothetical protein
MDDICHNNPRKYEQMRTIFENKAKGIKSYVLTSAFKKSAITGKISIEYLVKKIWPLPVFFFWLQRAPIYKMSILGNTKRSTEIINSNTQLSVAQIDTY